MGKLKQKHAIWLSLLGAVALPSAAQDAGGVVMTFGINQGLEHSSNLGLTEGGESSTTFAATRLSFGLTSQTGVDTLSFNTSGTLRIINGPDSNGTETEFDDLNARLSFARDVGRSDFSISARYREAGVEFTRPFSDFVNDDGDFDPPEDLSELDGTGDRVDYGLDATMNLMKDGPFGLSLRAGFSGLDYKNTTDADLNDVERANLGATATFLFTDTLDGELSIDHRTFQAEDADLTDRETNTAKFQLGYDYSETIRLTAAVGYTRVETDAGIGLARMTTVDDGVTAGLGIEYQRPNGVITANIESTVDQDGRRLSYDIGRSFDFKDQTFGFSIGQVRDDNGETALTAALNWSKELPTGSISAKLTRGIATNSDDENELTTRISATYEHTINNLSSVIVNGSYAAEESLGGSALTERADLSATYNYELTSDWDLRAGYRFEMRNGQTTRSAENHTVFLNVGREFSIRP